MKPPPQTAGRSRRLLLLERTMYREGRTPFTSVFTVQLIGELQRLIGTALGGERTDQAEGDKFYRYERRFGTFTRTIGLPQGVTEKDVKASFTHGVLEVHVAKPEQAKPQKIAIAVDGTEPKTIEGKATKK